MSLISVELCALLEGRRISGRLQFVCWSKLGLFNFARDYYWVANVHFFFFFLTLVIVLFLLQISFFKIYAQPFVSAAFLKSALQIKWNYVWAWGIYEMSKFEMCVCYMSIKYCATPMIDDNLKYLTNNFCLWKWHNCVTSWRLIYFTQLKLVIYKISPPD